QRHPFSSSAIRTNAKIVQNPRVDEDGKELTIKISPRAAERLREITNPTSSPSATKEENPYHHLRITVTSGGCHGFQYMMSLEAASKIDPEEDTVFEAEEQEVVAAGPGEAKVVMDEPSLELLHGSTVDYTMELIGSQFKIVDNPRASSNCGCGTSFDVVD
ncbi:HesB/IscA family protein, partial [Aspergillus saccharolyticus JOP 1030-1]